MQSVLRSLSRVPTWFADSALFQLSELEVSVKEFMQEMVAKTPIACFRDLLVIVVVRRH